ncbi:MAG: hypothetical protein AABY65_13620 [Nitrospirota bacterium]
MTRFDELERSARASESSLRFSSVQRRAGPPGQIRTWISLSRTALIARWHWAGGLGDAGEKAEAVPEVSHKIY